MTYGTAYENRGEKTDFFMKNKVTLVTGAAWGIGLTTARAFAQAGAIAVLSDINEPAQQAEELVKQGFKVWMQRITMPASTVLLRKPPTPAVKDMTVS